MFNLGLKNLSVASTNMFTLVPLSNPSSLWNTTSYFLNILLRVRLGHIWYPTNLTSVPPRRLCPLHCTTIKGKFAFWDPSITSTSEIHQYTYIIMTHQWGLGPVHYKTFIDREAPVSISIGISCYLKIDTQMFGSTSDCEKVVGSQGWFSVP